MKYIKYLKHVSWSHYKISILAVIIYMLATIKLSAQCPCLGAAPVGGLLPASGSTNIGIIPKGNIRASISYLYSAGNKYYNGDSPADSGDIKEFSAHYLGLGFGYGIFEDFSLEADLGYFPDKTQEYVRPAIKTYRDNGFSHLGINAKYNILNSRKSELEWTIGGGFRIPLKSQDESLPQNVRVSTGAFSFQAQSFLHKSFVKNRYHLILFNLAVFNARNSYYYRYGSNYINSIFGFANLTDDLSAVLELRSDIRMKDENEGKVLEDSGWNNFIISPKINYSFDKMTVTIAYDWPAYRYYNGRQLVSKFSVGANINWQELIN